MSDELRDGFVVVDKAEFFATVGPMNVHPRPFRERTIWETPDRVVVGIETPGYLEGGLPESLAPRTYAISAELARNRPREIGGRGNDR